MISLTINTQSHADTYRRAAFGGNWADDDHDCHNTRAEVLIGQSLHPVTFAANGCTVATGLWHDPWSETQATVAQAFDIDHTVPAENAWVSGAWQWTNAQRVAFYNDLATTDLLLAIPASENRSKGDQGPDGWRPPTPIAWCRYARSWDHIKAKWHLSATVTEWSALVNMTRRCPS